MNILTSTAFGLILSLACAGVQAAVSQACSDDPTKCTLADCKIDSTVCTLAHCKADSTVCSLAHCKADYTVCTLEHCKADYKVCTLEHCFSDPDACKKDDLVYSYAEMEPNDNLHTANPLLQKGKDYWGQSYGADDQDWFSFEAGTDDEGKERTLLIRFKSEAEVGIDSWRLTIRDSAGNIVANYNTSDFVNDLATDAFYYQATLRSAGDYFVVVQATPAPDDDFYCGPFSGQVDPDDTNCSRNYSPYAIAYQLLETEVESNPSNVGFFDAENEPNDLPEEATPLVSGVTMYGQVNLAFNELSTATGQWLQKGDYDWFRYETEGNELLNLTFCDKADCDAGIWTVEVYSNAGAEELNDGKPRSEVRPLLAFNTDNVPNEPDAVSVGQPSSNFRIGLKEPGPYYLFITGQREFTTICDGWKLDLDNDGLIPADAPVCSCPKLFDFEGNPINNDSCQKVIKNPGEPAVTRTSSFAPCPGTGIQAAKCDITCVCAGVEGGPSSGCRVLGSTSTSCHCAYGLNYCEYTIPNMLPPVITETYEYPLCPGTDSDDRTADCNVDCLCTNFKEIATQTDAEVTSPYNFTWFGTQLTPQTP